MRILIATGGAAHSNLAVQMGSYIMGTRFTSESGSVATLLMVIKHEAECSRGEAVLAGAITQMDLERNDVQTRIRIGNPAKEIIREIEERNYDLVILGSRPTHALLTRLLGSTAEWVIAHATCPVIVVKGNPTPIQRILLCVTAVEIPSQHTLFTRRLVSHLGTPCKITVLHVMSQISAGPRAPNEWQLYADASELIRAHEPEGNLLEQDMAALQMPMVEVRPRIRHGQVVDEILSEAQEGSYDLIAIGAHQARGWERFLLDDLAHQITVKADRPVLIV
jgi:nucleotide-binding universal stress UspA family protein